MNTGKTAAHAINFVINRSLDEGQGDWYAKVGKNEVGEKAIIFFQKDQKLSLGMKLALLTGSVKKGEEIAKKYLKELDLPAESIFNAQGKHLLKQRFSEPEANTRGSSTLTHEKTINSEKSGVAADVRVKITIKTKAYESAKNEFCKDLYDVFYAQHKGTELEKKAQLLIYGAAYDYLHGSENKASWHELDSTITLLKFDTKNLTADSPVHKHQETIKKLIAKCDEERQARANLKDLRNLQTNPNLDVALKNLNGFE